MQFHRASSFLLLMAPLGPLASTPSHAQCEVLRLVGPDTQPSGSWFGHSASLRGDILAVGENYGGTVFPPPGSAHIFERNVGAAAWVPAATLFASDAGDHGDQFGYSIAVAPELVVVGAPNDGLLGAKGAAYVFERQPDGAWVETAKLLPPDGAWAFGWSCDVDGDRIAVGAKGALGDGSGRVVIFEREGSAWVKKVMIKPTPSAGGDGFGASLDLEGERLVVGAPYGWTAASPREGLAFVYERTNPFVWAQKAVFSPDDLEDNDRFGEDVALDGDRIVVGAPVHDLPAPFCGAAYVFDLLDGVWTQTAKLTSGDLVSSTYFGWTTEVEGGRAVIGARSDSDIVSGGGAAYLFEEGPAGWVETKKFYGSGAEAGDSFSYAIDLEGSEVVLGAPYIWGGDGHPGKVYLFDLDVDGPSLLTDGSAVSLSAGGAQSFQLGACASHAGDVYVFAGSATGTSPGFALGGVPVPLNLDAYFVFTASNLGAPPLVAGLGILDAFGRADAAFQLPAGVLQPALAGVVLHHAYAVLDGATLQLEAVSGAVPVTLVP